MNHLFIIDPRPNNDPGSLHFTGATLEQNLVLEIFPCKARMRLFSGHPHISVSLHHQCEMTSICWLLVEDERKLMKASSTCVSVDRAENKW